MILIFKLAVGTLFGILLIALLKVVTHAMAARRFPEKFSQEVVSHRRWANIAFWLMVAAIGMTEAMVRFNGGVQNKGLLSIHLAFAVPFTLLLVILRFWVTGTDRSLVHKLLAYLCFGLYLGALATGSVLLWRA